MPLPSKLRQSLLARAHQLKAAISVPADGITDAIAAHVRAAFARSDLLKVRIHADSGAETDAAAAELCARVPCELVKRIGRVALLYRAPDAPRSPVGLP